MNEFIKNKSKVVKNNSEVIENNSEVIENNSEVIESNSEVIENNSENLKNKIENLKKNNEVIKNNGLKFGAILAIYYIITTIGIFFLDKSLFINIYLGFTNIFVSILIGVLCIFWTNRKLNIDITFKNAFTSFFITIVLGIFAHIIINYILFNIVDPSAKELIKTLTIEFTLQNMANHGVEADTIDNTVEQIMTTDNFKFGNLMKSFAWKTLLYSIVGMLIALIFKNKNKTIR